MKKAALLQEIFKVESKLLEISKEIRNASKFDSIESWIRHVLKSDPELAKHFVIPTEPRIKKALLDLVTIDSPLTKPVSNLLSTRIASYVAVIGDLKVHPMIGPAVKTILNNFQPLMDLVHKYDFHFEQTKSVEMIREALEYNRLHIYQSYPREPHIRIVLKTLQLDRSRDDRESLQYLLDFLFDQLKKNLQQPGFISQPRHAWWALLDLLEESGSTWLHDNSKILNEILLSFLTALEYLPKESDPASVVPEMNSPFNEEVWVTVNMMRVYRTAIREILPATTIKKLARRIDLNMKRISEINDDSIRNSQCKLLVFYEALAYLNYLDVLKLTAERQIDLRDRLIGQYLYYDDLVADFRIVKATIQRLITNRPSWTKNTLSSLLVSGPPASGKSELLRQIIAEIGRIAEANHKEFNHQFLTIGTEINTADELRQFLSRVESESEGTNLVRVIAFDEFDKAKFDFVVPFLKALGSDTQKEGPITFWLFGQSTHATFPIFKSYAESLEDKALRDFLTRLELGRIDLADLRLAPQQKIFTALGHAMTKQPQLRSVSRTCVAYFAMNEKIRNNRELIAVFERDTLLEENRLALAANIQFEMRKIEDAEGEWITIIK